MLTYKSFDVSTLEIGDIFHFRDEEGDGDAMKGMIVSIDIYYNGEMEYQVAFPDCVDYIEYTKDELDQCASMFSITYIKKSFAGLELI